MFTPAPRKPHVYVCILPKDFDPKIPFFLWMEGKFKVKHFAGLEYKNINSCRDSTTPGLSVLDLDHMRAQLPDVSDKKVFLNLGVPSPSETRGIEHSNTVLLDPIHKQIRVNEPMHGILKNDGNPIAFSPEIFAVLAEKYPGYDIIDEQFNVQLAGEKICNYVAVKIAQHYYEESPDKITREKILTSWQEDMNLFRPTQHPTSSVHNLHSLLMHISDCIQKECQRYLQSSLSKKSDILFNGPFAREIYLSFISEVFISFGHTYKRNDEYKDAAHEEMLSLEPGISYFSDCYSVFLHNTRGGQRLSANGEEFVARIVPLYKEYIDRMIKTAGLTATMPTEELIQKISEFQKTQALTPDEKLKTEFSDLMKRLMHRAVPSP
jgi:hypothetical protein